MQRFRVWWNSFKTVAILFSFTMNLVTLIVLLLVLMQVFQIKNGILEPLVDGLHKNFVGLDEAVIIRTIKVEDEIPVAFDLPLAQETVVVLTEDVAIDPPPSVTVTLPSGGGVINGRVNITLPEGLELPVRLDMIVPVDTSIPVNLPVDVQIPLDETQLHYPFANMRNLLEPYVRLMDHLPDDWNEVPDFTVDAIQGEGVNLVSPSDESVDPWPGTPTPTPLPGATGTLNAPDLPPGVPTMTITPFIPTFTPSAPYPTLTPTP